jgi:hypothetical protein
MKHVTTLYRGFDDDQYFQGFGEYQNIPKKGMYKTIQFWKEWGYLLWDYGYDDALPEEVQTLFNDIDNIINEAVKNHCNSL